MLQTAKNYNINASLKKGHQKIAKNTERIQKKYTMDWCSPWFGRKKTAKALLIRALRKMDIEPNIKVVRLGPLRLKKYLKRTMDT